MVLGPDYDRPRGVRQRTAPNQRPAAGSSSWQAREGTMTVYSGPVFDMAVNQFGVIANHLAIPMD
jgi:hypothetical protein